MIGIMNKSTVSTKTHVLFIYDYIRDYDRAKIVYEALRADDSIVIHGLFDNENHDYLHDHEKFRYWIYRQHIFTTVSLVLIGRDTAKNPDVQFALRESFKHNNDFTGVTIHNIEIDGIRDYRGLNPMVNNSFTVPGGIDVSVFGRYDIYDWMYDDGKKEIVHWITGKKMSNVQN